MKGDELSDFRWGAEPLDQLASSRPSRTPWCVQTRIDRKGFLFPAKTGATPPHKIRSSRSVKHPIVEIMENLAETSGFAVLTVWRDGGPFYAFSDVDSRYGLSMLPLRHSRRIGTVSAEESSTDTEETWNGESKIQMPQM